MTTTTYASRPAPTTTPERVDRGGPADEEPATRELRQVLDGVAHQVGVHGTPSVAPVVAAMADGVRQVSPGVASALVDWEGSEVSRQRAFGLAHRIVIDVLGDEAQARIERAMSVSA